MNKISEIYQSITAWIIPRSVFIPYWATYFLITILTPIKWVVKGRTRKHEKPGLCIEAGIKGWDLIEYKELYACACEYIGADNVHKSEIKPTESYYKQVKQTIKKIGPTHYVYSPRTGSQNWIIGLATSLKLSILLHWHGVVPIAALSDLPFRRWRAQCAVLTAKSGLVVAQMAPKEIHQIFPHRRLIGPCLMPFSKATISHLNTLDKNNGSKVNPMAVFSGSLYEPRTTLLKKIKAELKEKGHSLDINGHALGKDKMTDSEYWQTIQGASIIVTTADQNLEKGRDWVWKPHFLYRYTEVLACGRLLVAPSIPGVDRFFIPGTHFIAFNSSTNAAEKIAYYLEHESEGKRIARQGQKRIHELISSRFYWVSIDVALGKDSLL